MTASAKLSLPCFLFLHFMTLLLLGRVNNIPMMRAYLFCLLFFSALHAAHCANDDAHNANDDGAAGDDVYSSSIQAVEPCEKGVVQVTGISLLCNSPYTYYWGNGANRNSLICDYGDKVNIEVSFTVTDDIDGDIYMTMASTYKDEQLYKGESVELCYNFVGDACNAAGDYSFKKKIQFAYLDGNYTKFLPTLEIAFSDSADGSYSLGGVNIYCQEDENEEDENYVDWTAEVTTTSTEENTLEAVLINYGILIGTVVVVSGFSLFLWYHNRDGGVEITAANKEGLLA